MPGSSAATAFDVPYISSRRDSSLGSIYPGGVFQIVSGTQASPTVITTLAPHGLATGDTIFFTASTTANAALTAVPQQVVTVIAPTTFSVPVNDTVAGATAGAFDYAILSIPIGVVGLVTTGTAHGLRTGDTVTIVASGSTPSCDGAQVVTVVGPNQFTVPVIVTVAGSTTTGHYTKTIFTSDIFDRGPLAGTGGIVLTSVVGTAPVTTLVDIQGSFDAVNWYNVAYATTAAPQTALYAQLTITTATATSYKLLSASEVGHIGWRFLRLKFTSSTNIVVSATIHQSIT